MHLTNGEIAGLLHDYRQMKGLVRSLRAEMLRIAVDELGLEQKKAQQLSLETFLDGYLLGQEVAESTQTLASYKISGLLGRYQQAKEAIRNKRVEMLKLAVTQLGMEQGDALQANLEVFLDGYLIGQGTTGSWPEA